MREADRCVTGRGSLARFPAADGYAADAYSTGDRLLTESGALPNHGEVAVSDSDASFSESDYVFGDHGSKVTSG